MPRGHCLSIKTSIYCNKNQAKLVTVRLAFLARDHGMTIHRVTTRICVLTSLPPPPMSSSPLPSPSPFLTSPGPSRSFNCTCGTEHFSGEGRGFRARHCRPMEGHFLTNRHRRHQSFILTISTIFAGYGRHGSRPKLSTKWKFCRTL